MTVFDSWSGTKFDKRQKNLTPGVMPKGFKYPNYVLLVSKNQMIDRKNEKSYW